VQPIVQPAAQAVPAAKPAAAQPPPQGAAKYALQLGGFGVRANAEALVAQYAALSIPLAVVARPGGKFAVVTGAFESREQALAFGEQSLKPRGQAFLPVPSP
jgi:cell division protein FtsN